MSVRRIKDVKTIPWAQNNLKQFSQDKYISSQNNLLNMHDS